MSGSSRTEWKDYLQGVSTLFNFSYGQPSTTLPEHESPSFGKPMQQPMILSKQRNNHIPTVFHAGKKRTAKRSIRRNIRTSRNRRKNKI